MREIRRRRKCMHPDREPQPVKEVRQRVEHFQFPNRQKRRRAKQDAKERVREKRPHADEKLGGEVTDFLMNHISCGIAKTEKANVEDLELKEPAEKKMTCLMDNDAWKSKSGDDRTRNKE